MPAQPRTYTQAQIMKNSPCAIHYERDGHCYRHRHEWREGAPVCDLMYQIMNLRPGEQLDTCAEVTENFQ